MICNTIFLLVTLPCILSSGFYYTKAHTNATMKEIYTDCSGKDDSSRVTINSVSIKPNPPKKGQEITLDIEVQLLEDVTSGKAQLTVKLEKATIIDKTEDICKLATLINKQCPFKKGKLSFNGKRQIPDYMPSGDYNGKLYVTDQNNKELVCVEFNLSL